MGRVSLHRFLRRNRPNCRCIRLRDPGEVETAFSCSLRRISISDLSPKVENHESVSNSDSFFEGERLIWLRMHKMLARGINNVTGSEHVLWGFRKYEAARQRLGNRQDIRPCVGFIGRSLAAVAGDGPDAESGIVQVVGRSSFCPNIGPQLLLGSFLGTENKATGSQPKGNRGEAQQRGERGNERGRELEPIAKKRRPELGSFIFAGLCVGLAFPAAAFASDAWCSGRRVVGGSMFCIVALMGLQSTIGLLLGLDGWSIWRMLQ